MRWRIAWTICRKEALETVRDRRTLTVMLFVPIALYPLLLVGFSQVASHQVAELQSRTGQVLAIGLPETVRRQLAADRELNLAFVTRDDVPEALRAWPAADPEPAAPAPGVDAWVRATLAEDDVDAIVVADTAFATRLAAGETARVTIFHDTTIDRSREIGGRLEEAFVDLATQLLGERLQARPELPAGFARPLAVEATNVAPAQKRGGYLAGRVLPMLLIMMVLLGAFYPAVDLTAGEKERGTMQTLMTAPALPAEIIFGKFMTVFAVAMVSALANLLSMALAFTWLLRELPAGSEMSFSLDLGTILIVLLELVPIALLFSATMLAVAVLAQSYKEAQHYLTPVYVLIIVPVTLAGLPGFELHGLTAVMPVLNIMLLTRELLVDPPPLDTMALVLLANLAYAVLALLVAVRLFRAEQVLLGGPGAWREVWQRRPTDGRQLPTVGLSVGVYASALVLLLYIGTMVQRANIVWGMLITQWLLLLLPVLLVVRVCRLQWRPTLMLTWPRWPAVIGALLLGISAWAVLGGIAIWMQNRVLPVPQALIDQMREALGLGTEQSADWLLLTVFALSPGVCEEFLFRGLILAGLRRSCSKWLCVVLVGLLFGIFHVSIYRIVPTAVIGMLITFAALHSGSIWIGVIIHTLNNAMLLYISKHETFPVLGNPVAGEAVDWQVMPLYLLVCAVGLAALLLGRAAPPEFDSTEPPY